MRAIAILRPEPGNRAMAVAIEATGRTAIRLPLFETRSVAWQAPDPAAFDALILTSANAVGEATAEAARRAGFTVAATGSGGAAELVAAAERAGVRRALLLAGRERMLDAGGIVAQAITVYASDPLPVPPDAAARLRGSVALVQSARAGARLAAIVAPGDRAGIAVAAVGAAAAEAAGSGWERVVIAPRPAPAALIDAALALAD